MRVGLVTADRGVVTVFPTSWRAELVLVADEHADAGQPRRFSKSSPLRLVGPAASRLSAGQRVFLSVVRLCALQRYAGPRELVFDGSVLGVLDEEHREALRRVIKATRADARKILPSTR